MNLESAAFALSESTTSMVLFSWSANVYWCVTRVGAKRKGKGALGSHYVRVVVIGIASVRIEFDISSCDERLYHVFRMA